jgi:hypothetical protein
MMPSRIDRYEADVEKLLAQGERLVEAMKLEVLIMEAERRKLSVKPFPKNLPQLQTDYQPWYSEAFALVTQLLPDRVDDFKSYYTPKNARKEIDSGNYTISDYLRGLSISRGETTVTSMQAARLPLQQQVSIIAGLRQRFKSTLFDIKTLVHADLLDDEIRAAEELNSKGFQRGAGAIAGVVLEGHLAAVCDRNGVTIRKRDPTISDLNEALKASSKIETATWRYIQHLGDLRNKCDHKKASDPTKEEVSELIDGVRKITKTLF